MIFKNVTKVKQLAILTSDVGRLQVLRLVSHGGEAGGTRVLLVLLLVDRLERHEVGAVWHRKVSSQS